MFPIATMCQVLGLSTSGYYAWCRRAESAHGQRDRQLRVLVRASFDATKQRYGSPRIHEDLVEQEVRVSRKRVIRLMQEDGLKARARKRFKCTTLSDHDQPVAANLLDRQFTADAPNRRWVDDTTESAAFAVAAMAVFISSGRVWRGSARSHRAAGTTPGRDVTDTHARAAYRAPRVGGLPRGS